jgi:hypothetical protein
MRNFVPEIPDENFFYFIDPNSYLQAAEQIFDKLLDIIN